MRQISQLFQQSEFALAAYASLVPGIAGAQFVAALQLVGMTEDEADAFANRYRLIDQFSDGTGVSAAVFEDASGKRYLAIRGTESLGDYIADAYVLAGWPSFLNPQFFTLRAQVQLWMDSGVLPPRYTVTGHSLGGYLAAAIGSWFSANNEGTYLLNAPGVGGIVGNIVDSFKTAAGLGSVELVSNIFNIRASSGQSLIAGLGLQLVPPTFIETEFSANPFSNHSIVRITDSLAGYALLATLAPNLTIESIGALFRSAAPRHIDTQENIINALAKLFGVVGMGAENREQLYTSIQAIRDATQGKSIELVSLVNVSAFDLANIAQSSDAYAYRYALSELNPFAIVGDNAIYIEHNLNGELNLYNSAAESGLTRSYLADRAEMLTWKNVYYEKDGNVALRGNRIETYEFSDKGIRDERTEQDLTLTVVGRNSLQIYNPAKVIFGSDAGETLIGGNVAAGDRLYGGGGADTLQGGQGNDYLEGGAGNDTYVWNIGDGFDTILDTDGIGKLVVNGKVVSGGIKVAQNDFVSADKQETLHFEGDTISGGVLVVNGDLRIENFTSGDLGIVLNDHGSVAEIQPTATTIQSSLEMGTDFGTDGPDYYLASAGTFFSGKGSDDLFEGESLSYFEGAFADAGDDLLVGRALTSFLVGGAGRDTILGGSGQDQMFGDFASAEFAASHFVVDLFYFFESTDLEPDPHGYLYNNLWPERPDETMFFSGGYFQALSYVLGIGEITDLSTYYNDYLDGGDGDDLIVGGYGSDVLFGGTGNDEMYGGGFTVNFDPNWNPDEFWRDSITSLFGRPGDDYMDGGPGDDRLVDQDGGNDMLIGGDGNDVLNSYDPLSAESYVNYLFGGEGDDQLLSENLSANGFDVLVGGPGNDRLTVVSGGAYLEGGEGSNDYFIEYGPAAKVIVYDDDAGTGGTDHLSMSPLPAQLTPISPLSITRDVANLYFGFDGVPDRLTVENWFVGDAYRIEKIVFSGIGMTELGPKPFSQVYDIAAIESRFTRSTEGADFLWGTEDDDLIVALRGNDTLIGNEGNDILEGGEGDDHLAGGIGNDIPNGGVGDDTYEFHLGDGVDTIIDASGFDTLSFGTGITADMLTLGMGSLIIRVGEGGDAVHVEGFNPSDVFGSSVIEHFSFAAGSMLSYADLLARGFNLTGTAGNDTISGTNIHDRIDGGMGNDLLIGGAGSDTYFFGRGSGQDLIEDLDIAAVDSDTVRMSIDIAPSDLTISRSGDLIELAINGTGDQLSIRWQPEQGYGIERVEFSEGTTWDAATLESMAASGFNSSPTVSNPLMDQVARKGMPFDFQVPENAFRDIDPGDVLHYSATLVNGEQLPEWLSFDAVSRNFSGTPAATDAGAISILVTASDLAGTSATDDFQLVVSDGRSGGEVEPVGMEHNDDHDHDRAKRDDERYRKPVGGKYHERDDDRSQHKSERMAQWLATYFESKPRYDFEALALELESSDWNGEMPNGQEIARLWQIVGRYASALAHEHDEDTRGGAQYRFSEHGLFDGGAFGGGFGYTGSTGMTRGSANLRTLQGLEEGLQRLHA